MAKIDPSLNCWVSISSWYKNGILSQTRTESSSNYNNTSSNVVIGAGCRTNYFQGKLDDVRIYDTAITASEVKQLYNQTRSYHGYLEDVRFYGSSLTQAQAISLYKMRGSNAERKEPVGHWTMNEITGDGKLKDISIEANHGTINSGPSFATDRHGNPQGVIDFDGTDDYISISHNDNLDILETLTVSCWFKCNGTISNEMNLVEKDTWDGNFLHFIKSSKLAGASANFSSPSVTLGTASGNTIFGVTTLVSNNWHHFTSTYEKISSTTKVSLYLNGTLDGEVIFNGNLDGDANEALTIGGRSGSSNYFDGKIDDVRIYNTALSAEQIKNIYNQQPTNTEPVQIGRHRHYQNDYYMGYLSDLRLYDVALTPPEIRELFYHRNNGLMINGPEDFPIHEKNSSELPDPVAHYRMDERSGTTIRDSSGNGYHGTSSGIANSSFLAKGHDGRVGSAINFDGTDDLSCFASRQCRMAKSGDVKR